MVSDIGISIYMILIPTQQISTNCRHLAQLCDSVRRYGRPKDGLDSQAARDDESPVPSRAWDFAHVFVSLFARWTFKIS